MLSGVLMGAVPQLCVQALYALEWGSFDVWVLYAAVSSVLSLFSALCNVWRYRHSHGAVRRLMLDADFTKPYFFFVKSQEIYAQGNNLVHRSRDLVEAVSSMINVPPSSVEVDLCYVCTKGIKVAFVEYSGTKDAKDIAHDLAQSINDGWFASAVQSAWRLTETPVIELFDEQTMYDHRQLLTADLIPNLGNFGAEEGCCNYC